MSSHNFQFDGNLGDMNRKFDNQFADINSYLDKVIERNNKVVSLSHSQAKPIDNFQNVNPPVEYSNVQYLNKQSEGITKANNSYLTPRQDDHYSQPQFSQSPIIHIQGAHDSARTKISSVEQDEGFLKTPNKYKNIQSSRSTAFTQNEDSYDYSGGQYSSPAKRFDLQKPTKAFKGVEMSQEIALESTIDKTMIEQGQLSKDNLDSPKFEKNILGSKSIQNIDHSNNQLNVSHNTDIFGDRQNKFKLPRQKRAESAPRDYVGENLLQYEKDLTYANKYAPQEVLMSIEPSEDGQFFLVDPVKPEFHSFRKNSFETSKDPIDQIVVLTSPAKDVKPEDKLLGIYQQVSEEYLDGTSYVGEKFLGLRQGKGTYYYHEGYRYEGTWEEDKMSGFGILWVADDIKWYEGEWSNNTFNGKGIIYNLTPEELEPEKSYGEDLGQIGNGWVKYEGNFVDGAKQGFGTLFLTNGDTFTGNFEGDSINGRGSYKTSRNMIAGTWKANVLKSSF